MTTGIYGPVTPQKYPSVGPNYMKYGDRPGWVYVPWADKYVPDPKAKEQYLQDTGLAPKPEEPPGLADQLLPLAGTTAAIYGAQALVPELIGSLGSNGQAGSGLLGVAKDTLGFGPTQTTKAATDLAMDQLSGEAANAAWNAGADAATQAADPTLLNLGSNFANNALGAAGVGLGAYGAFQGIKDENPLSAGLGGMGIGLGLNQLGLALSPVGWAAAIGVPAAAALFGGDLTGDKDMWATEGKRARALAEQGINVNSLTSGLQGGASREDVWGGVNSAFAKSGDEKDLTAQDTMYFALHPELLGAAYQSASDEQRMAYNQRLIDEGLLREHHLTLDYTDPERAQQIWNEVLGV